MHETTPTAPPSFTATAQRYGFSPGTRSSKPVRMSLTADFEVTLSFRDGREKVREWFDADPAQKEPTARTLNAEGALDRVLAAWHKSPEIPYGCFQGLEKRAIVFPMSGNYKYLFGPVPSRRLGRSLGIDVTPFKTCSYDCIFCQCGGTTRHVAERGEFVPFEEVCAELERWLAEDGRADYITFAGSGEPTLYSRLGELIDFIKARTEIPVIVLSNGTLFHRLDVCDETAKADIVKMSLSAWDKASFQKVNRPAPGLSFETMYSGEQNFRQCFSGQLWLEVFLVEGVNAEREQVQKIAAIAAGITPDKIHLNTAVRPATEADVRPVDQEKLESLRGLFTPRAEVIASFEIAPAVVTGDLSPDSLVCLIHRHPATAEQLAAITGSDIQAILEVLAPLIETGQLHVEERNGDAYYK